MVAEAKVRLLRGPKQTGFGFYPNPVVPAAGRGYKVVRKAIPLKFASDTKKPLSRPFRLHERCDPLWFEEIADTLVKMIDRTSHADRINIAEQDPAVHLNDLALSLHHLAGDPQYEKQIERIREAQRRKIERDIQLLERLTNPEKKPAPRKLPDDEEADQDPSTPAAAGRDLPAHL
jgi:hypothetical protein